MILDTLENFGKYVAINPLFSKVEEYLQTHDLSAHESGKEMIDGANLFVNYSITKGKTKEAARIETHNAMIDIQIPLSGSETMGFTPRQNLPEAEYDAAKDICFYEGLAEKYITVHPGEFVIFFPQDGHAPCIADTEDIKKVIFKIKA
ncbi:MAG: YhcH/YjgK/YiaL family protein [Bacteroidaceae bacterium]|nr:YhcH/YjgK/YiaL family protein [Bacteroidaceae bacterium]